MVKFQILISSCIVGTAVITAAFIFTYVMHSDTTPSGRKPSLIHTLPAVMTKAQVASYLQVDQKTIDDIINNDKMKKAEMGDGVYDTYQFFPYIKIGSKERFLKTDVDQWAKYKSEANPKAGGG